MSLGRGLRVKIFADGAELAGMVALASNPQVHGFTTNPTLMRKAGVSDYVRFGRDAVAAIPDKPISFEVFSDDFDEMEAQAHEIASWGRHVYVKIPVTNTHGDFSGEVIRRLSHAGVKVNVTAVMTPKQVERIVPCLSRQTPAFVSIFAGRIADSGRDPVPIITAACDRLRGLPLAEVIWASPREVFNIVQADQAGCHVITVTHDLMAKMAQLGKDLDAFSLETVQMFRDDALRAGYVLGPAVARAVGGAA